MKGLYITMLPSILIVSLLHVLRHGPAEQVAEASALVIEYLAQLPTQNLITLQYALHAALERMQGNPVYIGIQFALLQLEKLGDTASIQKSA